MEEKVETYIAYEDQKYKLVEELSLEQFIDLYATIKQYSGVTEVSLRKMLGVVSGIPQDVVDRMNDYTLNHMAEIYGGLLNMDLPNASWPQTHRKEQKEFVLKDGVSYLFQPHYGFSSLGTIRCWEDFLGDRKLDIVEHLHYIIAICARSKDEVYDPTLINVKARLVLDSLSLKEAYHPLFFFLRTRNEVLISNERLFKKNIKKEDDMRKDHVTASNKNKVLSAWGWYHIANRMIEDGHLAKTITEIDDMNMIQVFEQLSYLHDVAEVKNAEARRREQAMKAQQPRRR